MIRRWTITLPDGSAKRGVGVIPPDVLTLLRSESYGGVRTKWELILPDGSVRKGTGELPADLADLVMISASRNIGIQKGQDNRHYPH